MMKIRLARIGVRNNPLYQIVIAKARSHRDKNHIEKIGYYDPRPDANGNKQVAMNIERVKHWIAAGAEPSDTMQKLLARAGLLPFKQFNLKIKPKQ
ncbi:hypothetical protein DSO57_1004759 [Entomophthora muscae]|uniref:Uncharacterized protein n=2 Tax=Entomophthora muscae TaxID=34485 RepID=A0ACC2SBA2_9FUNG|nr:hypothetical protein DSO57_1000556 [Entomophthora muscae]KAJ9086363.1 hypothetical protein DSO57_1004759 [Entomophthora muscae]